MSDADKAEDTDARSGDQAPQGPNPARYSAPDAVWDAVRRDYLAGLAAPDCCRRHGVGLSALRLRAARDGWRRSDQAWTAPAALDANDEGVMLNLLVDGDLNQVEPGDLVGIAYRRIARAVLKGDAEGALRWRRVARLMVIEQEELEIFIGRDRAGHARRRKQEDALDALDDLDDLAGLDDEDALDDPDASDASDATDGVFGVQVVRNRSGS